MSSNKKNQPKAGLSSPGDTEFDPAAWLDWAERCGYRIYLSDAPRGGGFRIVTETPSRPKSADDMALWHELQGHPQNRRANRAALIAHLVKIGCFAANGSAGVTSPAPEAADTEPSRPRPSGEDSQDGR